MKKIVLLLLTLLSASVSRAQYVTDYKKVADLYFNNKEYFAAAEYYKRALNLTEDTVSLSTPYDFELRKSAPTREQAEKEEIMFNLAQSYRLYKDFTNAEKWYAVTKNFSDKKYAISQLYYAEALRANKKFDQAIEAFTSYVNSYPQPEGDNLAKAQLEIASCKYALQEMRYPRLVNTEKLQAPFNAGGSNYAPLKKGQELYFTSSRPLSRNGDKSLLGVGNVAVKKKSTPYVNAIYNLNSSDNDLERLNFDLPMQENAAIALSPNGEYAYFTAWDPKDENQNYTLFITRKTVDNKWSSPENAGLQINSKGYNTMQPYITSDGKYLIFSSDRPGGYGNYDLWYAPVRADGSLGQAINMGETINTKENDQAAVYNVNTKKLIFSSDGRVGLGNMDFYESKGDFGSWSEPRNLGFPFNSSKDDIYFTAIDKEGDEAYISSDRESVCCLELLKVKREYITISGVLMDCETNQPIEGATVTIQDSTRTEKITLDRTGRYTFKRDSPRPVKIIAEKEGYFTKTLTYSYDDLAKADTLMNPAICLQPLVVDKPIELKDIYYEFNSAELNPHSQNSLSELVKIMEDNPKIIIELSAHTDAIGSDEYNMDLSQRRAQSCVDFLISRGVSTSRITAKGYGESMPIAPNTINGKDNPEGRALNRRTEFKVTKK